MRKNADVRQSGNGIKATHSSARPHIHLSGLPPFDNICFQAGSAVWYF